VKSREIPNVELRPITGADLPILRLFLLHAIHREPAEPFPSLGILERPDLRRYFDQWMRQGDLGVKALVAEMPVGAAWLRRWTPECHGYGWIREDVPELSMAVLPQWRGCVIGSRLLAELVESWSGPISLSVSKSNPAERFYRRFGFNTVAEDGATLTMLRNPA
jgi:ribosomal protein S18 acetylase RimI-like enzyme